jgi:diguanylate cyclase (GGDEF)-like protein
MAAFLSTQLDFIFFFYGLAFILLGGVCFAIRRHSVKRHLWGLLGAFGIAHGASEWFDLAALVLGDTPAFAVFRMGLMTVSFMLLLEFARAGAQFLGWHAPGRWIHVPILIGVFAGGFAGGLEEANALARYGFGFVGAVGSCLVFLGLSGRMEGVHKHLAVSAALAFLCYGIAAGLIVPNAPIWPANVLNYEWFTALTGMPIQLVRGLLACWIAFAAWGIWGQKIMLAVSAPHYTRHLKRLFSVTLATIGAILVLGWVLTQYLGDIYKRNVEAEATSDIELIVNYLTSETASTQGVAAAFAAAPPVRASLSGAPDVSKRWLDEMLALEVTAARAQGGVVLDTAGNVVASVGSHQAIDRFEQDLLQAAREGRPAHHFTHLEPSHENFFYASAPIRGKGFEDIRGVVIFERPLEGFAQDLVNFAKPLALVDPQGVVVLTNRSDWHLQNLWPVPAEVRGEHTPHADADGKAVLPEEVSEPIWTKFDGSRAFAQRKFIDGTEWSVVMMAEAPGVFASRVLGIAMTLMATGMVLVYLAGRERHIFDSFQKDQRLELEELARDLRFKATTDPLTGLANRLLLNHQLDQEIARAARYGTPVSFIIYDIDRFKRINDNYGHPAGDKVLIEISRLAGATIRKSDFLARWGGEEFAIIVPHAGSNEAAEVARALGAAIAAHIFDGVERITCSFGVAEYEPGDTAETLVARADKALYSAKVNGRNRVEIAPHSGSGIGRVA